MESLNGIFAIYVLDFITYSHLIMTFWKRRNVVPCFITYYRKILLLNVLRNLYLFEYYSHLLKSSCFLLALYGKEGLQEMHSGWIDGISKYYTDRGGDICKKEVKSITCPTLVVHGQKDPLVPQFHPEYLHENIPGCKLHVMPEGKHNLHLRYADEFNSLVKSFLNGKL